MVDSTPRRKIRTRKRIASRSGRLRLSVNVSNRHISAQLIDDATGRTQAYSTTVGKQLKGSLSERAEWVGKDIAQKAKSAKVKEVTFDRGSRLYHGRIKRVAEAARSEGLEF